MSNNIRQLDEKIVSLYNGGASLESIRLELGQRYPARVLERAISGLNLLIKEAARIEVEKSTAKVVEAERIEAERIEAEKSSAKVVEAARIEAEKSTAKVVKAARIEAEKSTAKFNQEILRKAEEQRLKNQVKLFSLFNNKEDIKSAKDFYSSHNELSVTSSNPCNKPTGTMCVSDWDMDRIFQQESLDNNRLKNKPIMNLKKESCSSDQDFNIPKNLHYVWLSSTQYTDAYRKEKFPSHNKYLEENLDSTKGWNQYLWTNDSSFIPKDIREKLESKGVKILSLDSLSSSEDKSSSLLKAAQQFAEEKSFGLATDIARYLIIQEKGGVYIDGDYKLFNIDGLETLMCSYNSVFGVERGYDVRLGNGFLAADPNNNVIKEVIDLSYRNIFEGNSAPDYVKYPCTNIMRTLVTTGPVTLSVAFTKQVSEKDALLPYGYLNILGENKSEIDSRNFCDSLGAWEVSHSKKYNSAELCKEIGEIAAQDFGKSWQLSGDIDYDLACNV